MGYTNRGIVEQLGLSLRVVELYATVTTIETIRPGGDGIVRRIFAHRLAATIAVLSASVSAAMEPSWDEPVDVAFRAECDGTTQRYVLMLPRGFDPSEQIDVMVALHGHGSDRWQFIRQNRSECQGLRDVAAQYGMIVVSPDYRAKTSWMGPKAEADVLQILEEIKKKYRIRHTFVCGGSMGASSALTFAVLHPERVDGVVALNGTANHVEYTGFQDAISRSFGGTKEEIPTEYRRRSAELRPDRLTMAMAATIGGRDKLVPPDSVRRLFAVLKKQDQPVLLIDRPEGGHSTDYKDTTAAIRFVVEKVRIDLGTL